MKAWWKVALKKKKPPEKETADETCAPPPETDARERLASLTSRENQVFDLLMQGRKLQEIADELGVKFSTINTHQKSIYRKLNVNSRAECFVRYGGMNKLV